MKATFFLPAHPSYFTDDEYTQAEIDKAIEDTNAFNGGKIVNGNDSHPVKTEYVLLREAGKDITVVFNLGDHREDSDIEQYRRTSFFELKAHVNNIKNFLLINRAKAEPL